MTYNIPSPRYPLNKYSTKQLLAWVEDCELVRCIAWASYLETSGNESIAHWSLATLASTLGYDIVKVMESRKLGDVAQERIDATSEDFNS